MWIDIAEWIVLGIAVLLILAGIVWTRRVIASSGRLHYPVLGSNAMYVMATVAVVVLGLSPLHLLWLFPVAFVVGTLGLAPPFSWIITPLGKIYGNICCIGLTRVRSRKSDRDK